MGTYVEDCLESMYMLPSEIKRNFDLMRDLDKTSYPLFEDLKSEQKAYLIESRQKVLARCNDTTKGEPTEQELRELIGANKQLESLKEKHALVVQKLDEKIAIAAQSYDIVDHHIRRLDRELESYVALLKANGEYQEDSRPQRKKQKMTTATTVHQLYHTNQSHATPHMANVRSKHNTVAAASAGMKDKSAISVVSKALSGGSSSSRKKTVAETTVAVPVATDQVLLASEDLPIDPNEPIYCSCRRVSFGQMVGCDNDDCKYEWFHFGCVGLTDQPAGKWYCHDCKPQLGIK
ncbi:unnamed protein product [Peronospora farinosa]|uniref:Inhibitor of growth protein n=2 Tax=Peronospora TaxID=70742 RepID=A0A3M6VFT1_9STRA|nr:hypothetical protein DD238_003283 [Peronospora effusa]RMX65053.1 hypothetical protein DD238_003259 [Peronospora effusa]CAH0491381.1 unnamed protein product [Peronospora farinosa]CAI5726124.1 unnamed protein product [Peronospora farinosa]